MTVINYDLDVGIKSASPEGIVATVTHTAVDVTVNGQRVLTPPDFDSLLYIAADGLPIDVEISADGIVGEVDDWDSVKATLIERAKEKAGERRGAPPDRRRVLRQPQRRRRRRDLRAAARARAPPAGSSSSRRPARRQVEAKGVALPSFTSNAKGNWTFSLVDAPTRNRRARAR